MGVSLTWKPSDPKSGNSFGYGGKLHAALSAAFGPYPITLTNESIPTLRGIGVCGFDEQVSKLIDAINENDSIEISDHW